MHLLEEVSEHVLSHTMRPMARPTGRFGPMPETPKKKKKFAATWTGILGSRENTDEEIKRKIMKGESILSDIPDVQQGEHVVEEYLCY